MRKHKRGVRLRDDTYPIRHGQNSVYLESLGCNKNTVDSEVILTLLEERGFITTHNPEEASHIIVNTCTFIDDAKQESIDTILELSHYKKNGSRLIVAGCFAQAYSSEIIEEMPEVDAVIGVGNLNALMSVIESKNKRRYYPESSVIPSVYREYSERKRLLTGKGYAYIKIAEGCNRNCSFCVIPRIKGKQRSRKIENIVEEAISLERSGIRELIITSQDTLQYGTDRGIKHGLKALVNALIENTSFDSLRLLYLTPRRELLHVLDIFENPRVTPYFDIPIQHVSKKILHAMNRWGDEHYYAQLINQIRERVPQAVLRTTIMVGFPDETEEDFKLLYRFVKDVCFHHLGVFTFSPQEQTPAFGLRERVNRMKALERKRQLLSLQGEISERLLQREVGKTSKVLIEERIKNSDLYIGRSYHFTPEVDGVFVVRSREHVEPGNFITAKVTRAETYDLHGKRTGED